MLVKKWSIKFLYRFLADIFLFINKLFNIYPV